MGLFCCADCDYAQTSNRSCGRTHDRVAIIYFEKNRFLAVLSRRSSGVELTICNRPAGSSNLSVGSKVLWGRIKVLRSAVNRECEGSSPSPTANLLQ